MTPSSHLKKRVRATIRAGGKHLRGTLLSGQRTRDRQNGSVLICRLPSTGDSRQLVALPAVRWSLNCDTSSKSAYWSLKGRWKAADRTAPRLRTHPVRPTITRFSICPRIGSCRGRRAVLFTGGAWPTQLSFAVSLSRHIIYHRALGAENIRRRALPSLTFQRLLSLDYILEHPQLPWLPTEQEKVRCFGLERRLLPSRVYRGAVGRQRRYFALKNCPSLSIPGPPVSPTPTPDTTPTASFDLGARRTKSFGLS